MPILSCPVEDEKHTPGKLTLGMCAKHYQRHRKYGDSAAQLVAMAECTQCGAKFDAKSNRAAYCSQRCRDRGKPSASGLTCFICSEPMVKGRSSKPQGEAAHNKCRTEVGGLRAHGKSGYRGGCRCAVCKEGQRVAMSEYADAYRAEHGVHPSTAFRKRFRDENGYWPNKRGSDWIAPKLRLELYERDAWTCYLCESPVDREGSPNGDRAPSLDHVLPKSLGGSDDPSNLKTACRACNSRKGVSV